MKRAEPKPVIKREQLQPTCFTCGVKGHKSPDCPKMVKRAVKAVRIDQSPSLLTKLKGKVAGKECIFTLDSGANITVVASDLVDGAVYTGKTVALFDFDSVAKGSYPTAKVWCHVSNHSFLVQAAVSESLQGEVLLGRDVPGSIFLPLLNEAQTSNIRVNKTRLQERRRLASQQSADRRGKRDGATLVTVSPEVVQPLPTDMLAEPDITPEDGNDSISIEEGEHVQMVEGSEGLDVPPVFSVQEQAKSQGAHIAR